MDDLRETLTEVFERGVAELGANHGLTHHLQWCIRREGVSTELVGRPLPGLVDANPGTAAAVVESYARLLHLSEIADDDGEFSGYAGVTGNLAVHLPPVLTAT